MIDEMFSAWGCIVCFSSSKVYANMNGLDCSALSNSGVFTLNSCTNNAASVSRCVHINYELTIS